MLPTTLVSRPTELDIGTYLVCTYFRAIKFDRMAYILKAHTRAFVFNFEIYHKISSLKENNLEWYIVEMIKTCTHFDVEGGIRPSLIYVYHI